MKDIHIDLKKKPCGDGDMATSIDLDHWEYFIIDINTDSLLLIIKLLQ